MIRVLMLEERGKATKSEENLFKDSIEWVWEVYKDWIEFDKTYIIIIYGNHQEEKVKNFSEKKCSQNTTQEKI